MSYTDARPEHNTERIDDRGLVAPITNLEKTRRSDTPYGRCQRTHTHRKSRVGPNRQQVGFRTQGSFPSHVTRILERNYTTFFSFVSLSSSPIARSSFSNRSLSLWRRICSSKSSLYLLTLPAFFEISLLQPALTILLSYFPSRVRATN